MTPRTLLSLCLAAAAALAAGVVLAAEGPCPVPAHPDLLDRVGRKEVARLHQKV